MIATETISPWADYELLDTGGFEKLERFGPWVLARPEPQAIWDKQLPEAEWDKQAHAVFKKEKGNPERGQWQLKKGMPEQWFISYRYEEMQLRFRLGLSSFKHVGIFPEQSRNWQYIYDSIKAMPVAQPKVLNLFAYTGAASLAARAAGADTTHLDSIKQVVSWARANMEASGLENIRWMVEDALTYVRREAKRGRQYQGLILDPPAYGRGPNSEKWQLEDHLNELLSHCAQILDPEHHFLVINLYSLGFSALILENLMRQHFPYLKNEQFGELYLPDQHGRKLPLGTYFRFRS